MFIDKNNGEVVLPSGFIIRPDMTQSSFKKTMCFEYATPRDYGTLPFIHYFFETERLEEKPLCVNLSFYGELLLSLSINIDLYSPGPKTWENYSLDIEACTKEFHYDLLKKILGKPHKKHGYKWEKWPVQQESFRYFLEYKYDWGNICSCHDRKGGGTNITVSYGNRLQESCNDYKKNNVF